MHREISKDGKDEKSQCVQQAVRSFAFQKITDQHTKDIGGKKTDGAGKPDSDSGTHTFIGTESDSRKLCFVSKLCHKEGAENGERSKTGYIFFFCLLFLVVIPPQRCDGKKEESGCGNQTDQPGWDHLADKATQEYGKSIENQDRGSRADNDIPKFKAGSEGNKHKLGLVPHFGDKFCEHDLQK